MKLKEIFNALQEEYKDIKLQWRGERTLKVFDAIESWRDDKDEKKRLKKIQRLLKANINPDLCRRGEKNLLMACIDSGYPEDIAIMKAILAKGADINRRTSYTGETALMYAVTKHARGAGPAFLVEAGADVYATNNDGNTPIMYTAGHTDPSDVLKAIIDKKHNLNFQDTKGDTPLIAAASYGMFRNTEMLITGGASLDLQNHEGKTALLAALLSRVSYHSEIAEMLIKAGADIEIKDKSGMNALLYTVFFDLPLSFNDLIAAGADINAADARAGKTPLMYAAANENQKMFDSLMSAGADTTIADKNGWTALDHARYAALSRVLDQLIETGGSHTKIARNNSAIVRLLEDDKCKKADIDRKINAGTQEKREIKSLPPIRKSPFTGNSAAGS